MRTVFSYPGNMADAQQSARALYEADALKVFVTTFAYRPKGWLPRLLAIAPETLASHVERQLARRAVTEVPQALVRRHGFWEIVRTATAKCGGGAVWTDRVWDLLSHDFDRFVARRYASETDAVAAYEYTALETFRAAALRGVARILHLPSLDSREFRRLVEDEVRLWPDLRENADAYFDRKFERRCARREEEIELADMIVANSSLTARSHIAAGADRSKMFVVPLASPPPVSQVRSERLYPNAPLKVIWAGNFSVRKGAHYMLEAWRRLAACGRAELHVFGECLLPEHFTRGPLDGLTFHGSVPQLELFDAYERMDVLAFPTLSDGWGMVLTEAFARGLPVITTDRAGAADLATPENALVIPSRDPEALAEALRWCLDNRQALVEMRFAALETARLRQWEDFRRDLVGALDVGLRRAGFEPRFRMARAA